MTTDCEGAVNNTRSQTQVAFPHTTSPFPHRIFVQPLSFSSFGLGVERGISFAISLPIPIAALTPEEVAMLPIKTIVHPTDFSANSRYAWEVACALARDYGANLLVIHVEPPAPSYSELGAIPPVPIDRHALERQLAEVKPSDATLSVARTLRFGDEMIEITKFASENEADLIVMGTHGRTGLGRLLMGSVAEAVLRHAPCPVLTVKTPLKGQAKDEFKRDPATCP